MHGAFTRGKKRAGTVLICGPLEVNGGSAACLKHRSSCAMGGEKQRIFGDF
jgi:hypothetical protein